MLTKRHYIKNIEKIIEGKLKKLKLKQIVGLNQFIKKNKRFYSAPCLNQKKEKFFFKILACDEPAPIEAIKKEIKIREFLSDFNFKGKLKYSPLVCYDNKNFPYWFLYSYFKGKLLGHFYKIHLNNEKYIPLLIDTLFALQGIPQNSLKRISQKKEFYLWQRDYQGYLEMVKFYQREIKKEIAKKIDFKEIYNLFEKNRRFFEKSPLILAHGDFTLANFVISNEKLIIADWEQAHLDNFAYDISHLWIQLWRYPLWQKKLISEFLARLPKRKIKEFQELFRIVIITEALGELKWSIELCPEQYKSGVMKSALKIIKAALSGFDNLKNL